MGEKPPDKISRGEVAIPTQASLGIASPSIHQIPEEPSVLQPAALTSTARPFIVIIWYCTGLPPHALGQRSMLLASKPRIPGNWTHYPPGTTLPTQISIITTPTTPRSRLVRLFIVVIWYTTGLLPSVVGQSSKSVALKPRLPSIWRHHHPNTSLTTATTNTTTTASCSSIVPPIVISLLIDIDVSLPPDVRDRSILVASTHCCQHLSTATTYIGTVCKVPPTNTHSLIVILNYKPRLMPPTYVNGLMLATSHLHLPTYFLPLLQFLTIIQSLPHFISTASLSPAFRCLLSFVPRPSHMLLGIVGVGTSDSYLSICTMIFNSFLLLFTPDSYSYVTILIHDNIHPVFTQVLLLPAATCTASHSAPSSISDGALAMLVQPESLMDSSTTASCLYPRHLTSVSF